MEGARYHKPAERPTSMPARHTPPVTWGDGCNGGPTLPDDTPDPLTPELAPFVAQALARLEADTEGLDHEDAVRHLEATVARAAVQASRLGFTFAPDEPEDGLGIGDGPVVVVQRLGEPG